MARQMPSSKRPSLAPLLPHMSGHAHRAPLWLHVCVCVFPGKRERESDRDTRVEPGVDAKGCLQLSPLASQLLHVQAHVVARGRAAEKDEHNWREGRVNESLMLLLLLLLALARCAALLSHHIASHTHTHMLSRKPSILYVTGREREYSQCKQHFQFAISECESCSGCKEA